jgi:chloramphenicol-sensitive protein RarD
MKTDGACSLFPIWEKSRDESAIGTGSQGVSHMTTISKSFTAAAAAAAAFAIWGVFPLYFHALRQISPFQVIAHRVVWSCVFVLVWTATRGEMSALRASLANRSVVWRLAVTATLITINWVVYVWAVMNGHVVESSLGYFINPLVNVLLGVALLSERLTRAQWTAVALAATGVAYLTIVAGRPPWIALTLAFSFGIYGLIRKIVKVESLPGLAIETLVLLPFAVVYLLWCESAGTGALGHAGPAIAALLIGSGPLTAIALFLFAYGARLLPYSTVGVLQYIAPTLQLACGVFVLHERFERTRAIGFALIWAALLIYAGEGLWLSRKRQRTFA